MIIAYKIQADERHCPETQREVVGRALAEKWNVDQVRMVLDAMEEKRRA
jgi:hypothetical protein